MTHRSEPSYGHLHDLCFASLVCALSLTREPRICMRKQFFFFFLVAVILQTISPCQYASRNSSHGSSGAFNNESLEVFRNFHGIAESVCTCPKYFIFQGFIEFLVLRIDVKKRSPFLHFRALVFLLASPVFLSAEISSTYLTKFLAIYQRVWTLLESSSFSSRENLYPRGGKLFLTVADHLQRSKYHLSNIPAVSPIHCVCPPEKVIVLEWDRKRTFLWHVQFVSSLNVMMINEASTCATETKLCFQFVLFSLLLGRIWFVRFLLEDRCGFLLLLQHLAEFGRMFGFQNFVLQTLRNR